jgi:hypothetical protein
MTITFCPAWRRQRVISVGSEQFSWSVGKQLGRHSKCACYKNATKTFAVKSTAKIFRRPSSLRYTGREGMVGITTVAADALAERA